MRRGLSQELPYGASAVKKDARSSVLHPHHQLGLIQFTGEVVGDQHLQKTGQRGIPQHGIRGRADQALPPRIQVAEPNGFLTKRLTLARADGSGKALEARRRAMKPALGRERGVCYFAFSFSFDCHGRVIDSLSWLEFIN